MHIYISTCNYNADSCWHMEHSSFVFWGCPGIFLKMFFDPQLVEPLVQNADWRADRTRILFVLSAGTWHVYQLHLDCFPLPIWLTRDSLCMFSADLLEPFR